MLLVAISTRRTGPRLTAERRAVPIETGIERMDEGHGPRAMLLLGLSRNMWRDKHLESFKCEFQLFGKAVDAGQKEQTLTLVYIAVTEQESNSRETLFGHEVVAHTV